MERKEGKQHIEAVKRLSYPNGNITVTKRKHNGNKRCSTVTVTVTVTVNIRKTRKKERRRYSKEGRVWEYEINTH